MSDRASRDSTRITRRRLVGGGAALAALAAAGGYGRFALGDEFEEHVADLLGTPLDVAEALTKGARERLGDLSYEARASAFLAATTFPGNLAPVAVRERVVRAFVGKLIADSAANLTYLGLRPPVGSSACSGLVPPR